MASSNQTEQEKKNIISHAHNTTALQPNAYLSGIHQLLHDKWVPVITAWRVLRLQMKERPPVWRIAANILNKQSRTTDNGWSPKWELGEELTTPLRKTSPNDETTTNASGLD
jgi:hypothetical protein